MPIATRLWSPEGLPGQCEFGNLIWFLFNFWQFANKSWVAHIPLEGRKSVCSFGVGKNLSPIQHESQLEPVCLWTRQVTVEKESPGWPTKKILVLLNLERMALNYRGDEMKSCLWPSCNQNAGRDCRNVQIDAPFILALEKLSASHVTTKVTQPVWQQT